MYDKNTLKMHLKKVPKLKNRTCKNALTVLFHLLNYNIGPASTDKKSFKKKLVQFSRWDIFRGQIQIMRDSDVSDFL